MSRYTRWTPEKGKFDRYGAEHFLKYLGEIEHDAVPLWIAMTYTAMYLGEEDYRGMLDSMKDALKFRFMNKDEQFEYLLLYLGCFADCNDLALVREVLVWTEEWEKVYVGEYILLYSKAKLLEKAGEHEAAEKVRKEIERQKVLQMTQKRCMQ